MSKLHKALRLLLNILLVALSLLLITILFMRFIKRDGVPTLFGYSAAVVVSGSMRPALEINDVILSKQQAEYLPGDIILFQTVGGSLITHRVVAVQSNGYITQGDANNALDTNPVLPNHVVGKVVKSIPYIGAPIAWLQQGPGLVLVLLLCAALLLGLILPKKTKKERDGA